MIKDAPGVSMLSVALYFSSPYPVTQETLPTIFQLTGKSLQWVTAHAINTAKFEVILLYNVACPFCMMTSSNGNIFRVIGPLCWSPVDSPHRGKWRGALVFSLIYAWTNDWANNLDTSDLRRHSAHYDVTVICVSIPIWQPCWWLFSYVIRTKDLGAFST